MNFTVDYQKRGGIFHVFIDPLRTPCKKRQKPPVPPCFYQNPSKPSFFGGGEGRAAKAASCRVLRGRTLLGVKGQEVLLFFATSLVFFICEANALHPKQCTDEEHSTWSGGQRATWLWYDTDLDWHRASARASEPPLNFYHKLYFIQINFYQIFSFFINISSYL